ncbi:hypothetical protein PR003_g33737, partial [Phytophthora rubi]
MRFLLLYAVSKTPSLLQKLRWRFLKTIFQIPAFLSRQTDLLVAAANSGRLVNLKKGQMLSAETMLLAAKKLAMTQRDTDFILTERGSMFGYGDLVVDARNLPKLRRSY